MHGYGIVVTRVRAPVPQKQGLKLKLRFVLASLDSVRAPVPQKQGLKLDDDGNECIESEVRAPVPQKQGLKQDSSSGFIFTSNWFERQFHKNKD